MTGGTRIYTQTGQRRGSYKNLDGRLGADRARFRIESERKKQIQDIFAELVTKEEYVRVRASEVRIWVFRDVTSVVVVE